MAAARKKMTRRAPVRRSTRASSQPAMPEYMPVPPARRFGSNPLLVLLVIVLAFFTGFLFFKVQNLEKNSAGTAVDQGTTEDSAPTGPVDVDPGHLPVLGDKNAPVTVIEFADFQCPFCKRWFDTVEPELKKEYIDTGKVKMYYRHYAFLGDESTWAAEASECANEQGKFWEYHDYLYENQGGENQGDFSKENLKNFAVQVGVDADQFNSCFDSEKYAQKVKDDLEQGQKAGVQGTPSTFINGIMIDGAQPYANFKTQIDQELKK